MIKVPIPLFALPILLAACSTSSITAASTATPTALPTEEYRVEIQASAQTLDVGESLTVTGTIVGRFEIPVYYVDIHDQSDPPSDLKIVLNPGSEVIDTNGASNILEAVSINVEPNRVTAVLRARAPGIAEVTIGINGEIGTLDTYGRPFLSFDSRFSEAVSITVR